MHGESSNIERVRQPKWSAGHLFNSWMNLDGFVKCIVQEKWFLLAFYSLCRTKLYARKIDYTYIEMRIICFLPKSRKLPGYCYAARLKCSAWGTLEKSISRMV